MSAKRSLRQDENGTAILEFTATFLVFITLLFGVIEFSYAFYQWNAATKALQRGARYAAVSDPVMKELPDINGMNDKTVNPGDPLKGSYDIVCTGSNSTCTCTGTECPTSKTYVKAAMDKITASMSAIYPQIASKNVTVRYQYTKLGYAGRPGGPVPTITVSVSGLTFNFILMSAFLSNDTIPMPSFDTTVTGEDLKASS